MANDSGFDPVPFFIADKALHSADTVRALVYDATGGEEGVVGPGDLKVEALTSPGPGVRIAPGGYVVLNRGAGGAGQSYAGRAYRESRLDTPTTTAASGGSYMVVARIEDPQYSPWQPYPTVEQKRVGPYAFPRLLNCNYGATSAQQLGLPHSMVALARIDLPASTSVVLPQYITDLRELVNERERNHLVSNQPPTGDRLEPKSDSVWRRWPSWSPTFKVPIWANWVSVKVDIASVGVANMPTDGELRGHLSWPGVELYSGPLRIDLDPGSTGGGQRSNFVVTISGAIPPGAAGGPMQAEIQGHIATGSPGMIGTNPGTHMAFDVRFSQRIR